MPRLPSLLLLALLSLPLAADDFSAPEFQKPFANPTDNPALPRVLLIGDSISIAYTTTVRRGLKGQANVHRVKGNCAYSANGVQHVREWIGDGKWDLIHFNFGLWDWYGWKQDQRATPESYAANLEKIVAVLKTTGARLVFATTTPPCDEEERKIKVMVTEDEARAFRDAALAVMKTHGVLVNDLHATISADRRKFTLGKHDVHWNKSGSHLLGTQVARYLGTILAEPADLYPSPEMRTASPGKTTYHIDPVNGDDTSPGLAADAAWRTFVPLNQLRLAPGDRVEVMPGRFDHTLAITGEGTAEAPITVNLAAGRYDFHPDHRFRSTYNISNTNGNPDGLKAVGILLTHARHVNLTGLAAEIVHRGKMIQVCIDHCEDIHISNLSFDYHRPTVSELTVEKITADHVDLRVHPDSPYKIENGKLIWLGEGWHETGGLGQDLDPETHRVRRVVDPLKNLTFEEITPFHLRARGAHRLQRDHIYQIRNPFRDCAGAFTRRSRNITWTIVRFRFLHGMGLVNQFSENLTFDGVAIAPDRKSGRTTAAWADGIQVSGCRGKILVKECLFNGAHDDAINIHGTHLRVVERLPGNRVKVRFMHKQTFGFMAFNPGDEVEFVHWDSLATYGPNRVRTARLLNPKEMLLELEKPLPAEFRENDALENVTWTPEVEIRACEVLRIPTRGFLITTRRPVLVLGNTFHATHMSAILLEDDAKGWFESGCIRDMTIRRNRFLRCGEPVVNSNPQNSVPNQGVHHNIRIEENEFLLRGTTAVRAKSTTGLRVTGNKILAQEKIDAAKAIQTTDSADIVIENNIFEQTTL